MRKYHNLIKKMKNNKKIKTNLNGKMSQFVIKNEK